MSIVKICGLTNLADALFAAEAGADLLGFIMWEKSKRAVTADTVTQITTTLKQLDNPPICVGVFVNEEPDTIASLLDQGVIDLAQLHGDEIPALLGDRESPIFGRGYKAIRPKFYMEAEADAGWYSVPNKPSLLIDAYHPTEYGGTGEVSDWAMAAKLVQQHDGLLLAGGLTADNVAQAIREVRPWGVDVASGTEASHGVKDHDKVRAFIENAKEAFREEI